MSANPSGPVQALAPPEFKITARNCPSASTCSDQSTGAALTRLRVNTPAAAKSGPLLTTRARSGLPLDFSPAASAAAEKPAAPVTLIPPRFLDQMPGRIQAAAA